MPDPRIFPVPSVNDTFALVTAVSSIVLAENTHRVEADFTNDGDNVIYLARGHAAVIGSGQRLNPNGGSYHINVDNLFNGDIHAISTDETNLSISEGVRLK